MEVEVEIVADIKVVCGRKNKVVGHTVDATAVLLLLLLLYLLCLWCSWLL